jgi:PadR family transcriptional regulator, regulatory protein PadR
LCPEIISLGETYGYEITQQLKELGFTDVVEDTVYTITMRLEINNLVDMEISHLLWGRRANFTNSTQQDMRNSKLIGENGISFSSKMNELKTKELKRGG